MSFRMIINEKELEILDKSNIDYTFWDFEGLILNRTQTIEIEFDDQQEFTKAKMVLNK